MKQSIKQEILLLTVELTKEFCRTHDISFDTSSISEQLHISRSLASQYLNELVKEGMLIKVLSRPVFYLNKRTIEAEFQIQLSQYEFYDLEDLLDLIDERKLNKKDFITAIGYNTSLSYCISLCQSSVKYPPNGVPIIIAGQRGTGKTFLASLIYDYAKNEKYIGRDAKCLFMNRSSKEEINDLDLLFGNSKNHYDGLLKQANGGYVVIENAEYISSGCKDMLIHYINDDSVSDEKPGSKKARLIFTTSKNLREEIDETLLQSVPIACTLPALKQRPIFEKEAFIKQFLLQEERRINKKIMIYRNAYNMLLEYDFSNNISGLHRCIKQMCTKAFFDTNETEEILKIGAYYLPPDIINARNEATYTDYKDELVDLDETVVSKDTDYLINFYNELLNIYSRFSGNGINSKEFINACIESMNLYYDYIVFEKKYANERIRSIEKTLSESVGVISNEYDFYLPNNCIFSLARIIYLAMETDSDLKRWNKSNKAQVNSLVNYFVQHFTSEAVVAEEILRKIRYLLNIEVSDINKAFLILNLQFYNKHIEHQKTMGIIIAHGYSTASSIADATNKLIGKHVFKAIDMPLDKDVKDIIPMIKEYVRISFSGDNILLLVDMGSLEKTGSMLSDIQNVKIGIINNISTKVAIDIGYRILKNEELEKLLKEVADEVIFEYQVFDNRIVKPNAVIITSESGIVLTERARQLIERSMTGDLDFELVACDYNSLLSKKEKEAIFDKYNVLFIVSTTKIDLNDVVVIPMEDIVVQEASNKIADSLAGHYNKSDIDSFNRNLLKNFSLQNVIRHLTILDADKLLSAIDEALDTLQSLLNTAFANNTMVGLYIHIANMVERLVTNSFVEGEYLDKELNKEEKNFVKVFNNSFETVCKHYNIMIPQSEIMYIYRYALDDIK